jgi:hypothetical protein
MAIGTSISEESVLGTSHSSEGAFSWGASPHSKIAFLVFSALINYAHGDIAYGDLDAIEAALLATGGVG